MGKFIVGLVLGIAIAAGLAFYLNNMPNQFVKRANNTAANMMTDASSPIVLAPGTKLQEVKDSSGTANNNQQNASGTNASSPHYDFYNVLQGKNASDVQKKATKAQANNNPQPQNTNKIYVEAGVFANADATSNMAAQLTLLGYTPKVRAEQTGNNVTNQILIGPFDNADKANDVIQDLAKENIKAVVYKENVSG